MLEFFKSKEKRREACLLQWRPIIESAKSCMPESLPLLEQNNAVFFIDEWNHQYENADEQGKVGLAVLAYRIKINQYATGMLIDGNASKRLNGIRLLGHLRDEASWELMTSLINHENADVSLTAFASCMQINERRACDEFLKQVLIREDWPTTDLIRALKISSSLNLCQRINCLSTGSASNSESRKLEILQQLQC